MASIATKLYGYSVEMREMQCGNCGCCYAVTEAMMSEKERDGGTWYCPNGHPRAYAEPAAKKFEKLYVDEQRKRFQAESEKQQVQRDLDKINKRVKRGVCPCCKRSFAALHRHMQNKHPDFGK